MSAGERDRGVFAGKPMGNKCELIFTKPSGLSHYFLSEAASVSDSSGTPQLRRQCAMARGV
jgi:hypothetical protein